MTPSLTNFLLSLVAGAVVVSGIIIAVAVISSKDKLQRSD